MTATSRSPAATAAHWPRSSTATRRRCCRSSARRARSSTRSSRTAARPATTPRPGWTRCFRTSAGSSRAASSSPPARTRRRRSVPATTPAPWCADGRSSAASASSKTPRSTSSTTAGARKIARDAGALQAVLDNEAAVLRRLDGSGIAPRLLDAGVHDGRSYLVVEWIDGVDAFVAAAERRRDRAALLEICASIAAAYAALHARGVLHADVHPRNVLVGKQTTLIDFGSSRSADEPPRSGRGGIHYFYEPEYIAARRELRSVPASAAGEQYAVAALLYHVVTGSHYLDLRYDREEMERQIENDPPVPFAQRGLPPWPEVERILFRALEKDPARRHGSMAEMAALLAKARDEAAAASLAAPLSAEATALLETTLQSFSRGGAVFATSYPSPPTASVNFGCAGAAVGLLRIAEARSDPALLALAAVWCSRATPLSGTDGAYHNADTLSRGILGQVTPYHTESGIHAVEAMVAAAMGAELAQRRAVAAFIDASTKPCEQLDLTLGRSGSLLAAAMLLAVSSDLPEAEALRAFGARTMREIWEELDAMPPIVASLSGTYLGIAHGWGGYIYAALRWCAASGDALPPRLVERLDELAAMKLHDGRGAVWPMMIDSAPEHIYPGWCNGSAGMLFLFTLAHRLLGDARWLELAELCAWAPWDMQRATASLCCGGAGRAYALLNLYKHTGDTAWLSRARQIANVAAANAVATAQRPHSLWKGELGVAVLIADLASPENARMPFFE